MCDDEVRTGAVFFFFFLFLPATKWERGVIGEWGTKYEVPFEKRGRFNESEGERNQRYFFYMRFFCAQDMIIIF